MTRPGPQAEHDDWMAMSLLVSVCALVAVGLVVLPLFGPRVAAVTAAVVVLGIFAACYAICIPRVFGTKVRGRSDSHA